MELKPWFFEDLLRQYNTTVQPKIENTYSNKNYLTIYANFVDECSLKNLSQPIL